MPRQVKHTTAATYHCHHPNPCGRVDTAQSPELRARFGITGHPIFKWFPKGRVDAETFYFVHHKGKARA